jgi:putative oxidoreductase
MKKLMNKDQSVDYAVLLLRIVAGVMFFQAGGMKLFGWFNLMPGGGTVPLLSEAGIGGILELFGGAAIVLGILTRPIAFVLSGEMAVAYWQFHAPGGTWPIQNQGQPAVLYCFIFLFLSAYGAGRWSIDAFIHRFKDN